MPQVFFYLRNEDIGKWKAKERKAEFIHNALNGNVATVGQLEKEYREQTERNIESKRNEFIPKPPNPETGYPCCNKKRPCKHWYWNAADSQWVNELTGKTKVVEL